MYSGVTIIFAPPLGKLSVLIHNSGHFGRRWLVMPLAVYENRPIWCGLRGHVLHLSTQWLHSAVDTQRRPSSVLYTQTPDQFQLWWYLLRRESTPQPFHKSQRSLPLHTYNEHVCNGQYGTLNSDHENSEITTVSTKKWDHSTYDNKMHFKHIIFECSKTPVNLFLTARRNKFLAQ